MTTDFEQVKKLLRQITGDEKHSGATYSTLDVLWVLYDQVLRFSPEDPRSEERDRFVMSKGHGPLSLFAILAVKGFFPPAELFTFLHYDSRLGGHPDRNLVPGVETSTGSLGHGLPMALGMAHGLRLKHSDRRVYVLIGDGECNEGSIWEAVLSAGDQKLTNVTCIVINNHSSSPNLGDIAAKFAAFGWAATTVSGRDHQQLHAALSRSDPERPTAVIANIAVNE